MAWLSVGTTNEDLCDKLLENGVLEAGSILDAFRNTDRGDFVQQDSRLKLDITIIAILVLIILSRTNPILFFLEHLPMLIVPSSMSTCTSVRLTCMLQF